MPLPPASSRSYAPRRSRDDALLESGSRPLIAVPTDTFLTDGIEFNLTPSIASLKRLDVVRHIDAARLHSGQANVAASFVEFGLRGQLMRNPELWGGPSKWHHTKGTTDGQPFVLQYSAGSSGSVAPLSAPPPNR